MSIFSSYSCMKYAFMLLNFAFVLSGGVIIGLGIYVKLFYNEYEVFVDQQYMYAPDMLLAFGSVIFIISLLGFCGVFTKSSCLTLTYSAILILIFVFELAFGIAGYVMKNQAKLLLEEKLNSTITQYNTTADIRQAWNEIQNDFSCCGVNGPDDWGKHNMTIPSSCYKIPENVTDITEKPPVLQTAGCVDAFGDFLKEHSRNIQIIGLALAAVQLFGIMSSCYLGYQTRRGYEVI